MGNTSRSLRRLYSLDTSSPDFLLYLHCLIRYDHEERYLTSLKGPELMRLLDLLDKALDVIPTNDDLARECLVKLQDICTDHWRLPSSYTLSDELTGVRDTGGIDIGGGFRWWEGVYHNKEVHICSSKTPWEGFKDRMVLLANEVIQLKRLSHPNIVSFIGVTKNPFQIVMEWTPDRNLMEYLEEHPEANRVSLLLEIAEGLNYLHTKNFCLELGPNIIVDHEGHVRLTVMEPLAPTIRRRKFGARTMFLAPELRGRSPPGTPAGDVFSFGMVVIGVFTGRPPFSEFTPQIVNSKILDGIPLDRPQGLQKLGLTDSLWKMTLRCWHQDPAQRPSITEVIRLLRQLLVSSLSIEADLRDFFDVCKTHGMDGQGEKAREFAEELDEVLDNTGLLREKRKEYLRYLQRLCGTFDLLPSSFLLPQESIKMEAAPFDSGGYSSVFKATFKEHAIVIKVLNVVAQAEREKLHRLLVKEVVGWKWLRHENVLPFVGVMCTPSTPISIASELMENGNIMEFIRKNQDYNRIDLLVGAVTGLKYLHKHGIAHGDLKGVNILIDSQCRARLADFGLAKIVDESASRTATAVGKRQGTVRWMAPELLYPDKFDFTGSFEKQLPSKGTDVYAIGMTILEVITGRVPFASVLRNETVMLKVIQGDRPGRPIPGLSETLWNLLVATWVEQYAQKPQERPSASTVLARLKECVGDWGKSIIPLIPEDWKDIGIDDDPTITAGNFYYRIGYPLVYEEFE